MLGATALALREAQRKDPPLGAARLALLLGQELGKRLPPRRQAPVRQAVPAALQRGPGAPAAEMKG